TAAHAVLRSGLPVLLVALDASSDVPISRAFVDRLRGRSLTPAGTFVADLLDHQDDFVRSGQYYFWDPLAAAAAVGNNSGGLGERGVDVDQRAGNTEGALVAVDGEPRVHLAVSANAIALERTLIDTLAP